MKFLLSAEAAKVYGTALAISDTGEVIEYSFAHRDDEPEWYAHTKEMRPDAVDCGQTQGNSIRIVRDHRGQPRNQDKWEEWGFDPNSSVA